MRQAIALAICLAAACVAMAQTYRYELKKYYKATALNPGTVLITCLNGVTPRGETMGMMVVVSCVPKNEPEAKP